MTIVISLLIGVGGALGVLMIGRSLLGGLDSVRRGQRHSSTKSTDDRRLVDALAVWIEQLRDTLAGARGLEQAIVATVETAPSLLRPAVSRFAGRLDLESLGTAARKFAHELDHSMADFVSAVLVTASEHQVRDVGALLSQLAECCRDESRMRTRVWVSRARTRSAVRIVTAVVVLFVIGLFVFNRSYLEPYGTPSGSVVLVVVAVLFATSFRLLFRFARFEDQPRFIAATDRLTDR